MAKRVLKKSVGIILSFILVLSTFAISFQVHAADTEENIIIADVTKRYGTAQTIFNQVNQMRTEANVSELKMDKTLIEAAMKRAAELSIAYESCALDGSGDYGAGADAIVYGSCSLGFNAFLGMAISKEDELILKSSGYKSIGVGAVSVNGFKLVCILLSSKAANEVDSSIYNQGNVLTDQPTVCLKSNLKNLSLVYPDGYEIYSGSSCEVFLKVKNKNSSDTTASDFYALISSECLRVSSSDTGVISVSNGYLKAMKPGTSSITAYLNGDTSVCATSLIKVISLKFQNCKINDIGNMKYTGKPIEPEVIITDSDGNKLVKGEDYTLSYYNNISVGTASVKISGIGKYAGEERIKNFNIIPNEDVEYRVSMSVSASEVGADETINLTAKNNLDDTTTNYSFDYSAYGSNTWTTIQSASSNNSCSFKIHTPGKYIIRVTAENGSGMTATSQYTININAALGLSVGLNSDKIVLGNYINITAQATGSVSPYTYSYKIKNDSDGVWVNIKTNTTDTSATYKPTKTGSYTLKVRCTSKTGYIYEKNLIINVIASSLTNESVISSSSITIGKSVKIYASATGGTAPYTYEIRVKHSASTSWTTIKSYSTTASKTWTPAKTGKYSVCAKVKDSKGTEIKKFFTLTVNESLTNNSTISKTTINKGDAINLKAVAAGGTSPYQYMFLVKHSTATDWTTIKSYSSTATKTWVPSKTGKYQICAKVKDSSGTEVRKFFTLTVNTPLVNNSTISKTAIITGDSITLKAVAAGGSSPYQYAFLVKHSTATDWTTIKSYNTTATKTWTPAKTGKYQVCAKIKDSSGAEERKFFTLTVNTPLENNSTISKTTITKGESITLKAVAAGGISPYQYSFVVKHSTATDWTTIKSYSTTASRTWTPAKTGKYSVCAKVKDSNGTVVKKFFTLTVK